MSRSHLSELEPETEAEAEGSLDETVAAGIGNTDACHLILQPLPDYWVLMK